MFIFKVLRALGVDEFVSSFEQDPTTAEEFAANFKKVVGEDENQSAILSSEWSDFGVTWDQVSAKLAELEADYTATEYQRQRAPEYPGIADLADALYWNSTGDSSKLDEYYAACAAVKAKYPKPEVS
jgi:hypothetical protein